MVFTILVALTKEGNYLFMSKKRNIGINAILNVINQGLRIVFPLITYPYVIRTIGSDGVGKVTFSASILSYFALIARLGVSTYAVREGAKIKEDKTQFEKFSGEVFTINILTTVVAYCGLFIALLSVSKIKGYSNLILLQSISILLTTLGVDWINTIFEDYWIITIRGIISNLVVLTLLFLFVRSPEDYYIYAFMTVLTNGIICVSNWFYCRKYARIRITKTPNIRKHIKPLIILFANTIAITVYVNLDSTMIGWMKGDHDVGVYSVAVKIYGIVKTILAAIYAVAIPRLAFYVGKNQFEEYKRLNTDLWAYLCMVLVPSGVGLIVLAPDIMQFMGGPEYYTYGPALQVLGISLVFAIFGGLITACMNVTLGREADSLKATIISAFINLVLNLIFIPRFSLYGAAFTTMISEAFVFVFCYFRIKERKKYLEKATVFKVMIHSLEGSSLIVLVSMLLRQVVEPNLIRIAVTIGVSIILYFSFMLIIKDSYCVSGCKLVRNHLKRKWTH